MSSSSSVRSALQNVYLAVDISSRAITTACVDKNGVVLQKRNFDKSSSGSLDQRCINCVREALNSYSRNGYAFIGIGISTRGNVKNGVLQGDKPNQRAIDFKNLFEREFRLQTEVLNRFHAAALGICHSSKQDHVPCLGVINVSNGVGYGVVRSGQVQEIYDPSKGAGGLTRVQRLSDKRSMSIASIAGPNGLTARVREFTGKNYSVKDSLRLGNMNMNAERAVNDAVDASAELVIDLKRSFRPDKVVGLIYDEEGCSRDDQLDFLQKIEKTVQKKFGSKVPLELANIGETDAKLIGAARVTEQRLRSVTGNRGNMFVVTGLPGCGKTTFVAETLLRKLTEKGVTVGGIFSQEIRGKGGHRTGFSMNLLSTSKPTQTIELARYGKIAGVEWKPFSFFSVNVKNVKEFAVPALKEAGANAEVIIIDEVASMQLFSGEFATTVEQILALDKPKIITVPLHTKHRIIDMIKSTATEQGTFYTLNKNDRSKSQHDASDDILAALATKIEKLREPTRKKESRDQSSFGVSNHKRSRYESGSR